TSARKELAGKGHTAEERTAMPDFQVAALYTLREYRRTSADLTQWLLVPDQLKHSGFAAATKRHDEALRRWDQLFIQRNLLTGLADGGYGKAFQSVVNATGRIDRRLAILRCVEAVRIHAAADGGN